MAKPSKMFRPRVAADWRAFIGLAAFLCLLNSYSAWAGSSFELHDGERVVFLGDTLVEREQVYGNIEERLTVEFPDRNIIFRNLGWSADTPSGSSRASFDFDKPGKDFEKLKQELATAKPTVVILGYGMANSFAGKAGLPGFKADLEKLIEAINSMSSNGPVRFVVLSPIRHEDKGEPLPDPEAHNRQLEEYTQALMEVAASNRFEFVSLMDLPGAKANPERLTDNGIHLAGFGYQVAADAIAGGLRWKPNAWQVSIDVARIESSGGKAVTAEGTQVAEVTGNRDHLKFSSTDFKLTAPQLLDPKAKLLPPPAGHGRIQVKGLKGGSYRITIDGEPVFEGSDTDLRRGVTVNRGAQVEQAEALRQAILKKNALFFDRWRPQNETYLFGFRKYEQGQNAKEIPLFDPLITQQEAEIAKLRAPRKHLYEITAISSSMPRRSEITMKRASAEEQQGAATSVTNDPLPEFEIAPGFDVNLFAESPLLAKPTEMNFDPRGRLWISSSSVYPQIRPGQEADDKILVLEDTNGDGFAETSTVFADGLLIPTGVVPGDGGVYVGQSTELLYFRDVDGDGKADEKRIVLSGFGTEDTHHMVHTLHWGMDGQLYFNQSIYIHSHFETPHGVEHLNSGGVWHLRTPTMQLGVYLRGFCNPWGQQFDQFGQAFVTDGAGSQGLSFGIDGAAYFTYANMRRELQSVSPGNYPKFAGLEIVRTAQFPADWQGNALTCDFRAHRIVRFAIEEQGSGYTTRELPDLLRTTNVTFRPIDVKLGPDGALYIADWSNPIIQHGEVDFRDPRRDHEHGRIWRVTAKGRPLTPRRNFATASNAELFGETLSVNAYDQQQARRVLTERGKAIRHELDQWTKSRTNDYELMQTLWLYQGIDVVNAPLLDRVLKATDGRVRAAGTKVAAAWEARLKNPQALLAARTADDNPRVRLEAIRGLARIPDARSAELVLNALDRPMDPFLDYAIWLSINDLSEPWLAAVKSGAWKTEGHEKQLEFALKAIEPVQASEVLGLILEHKPISKQGTGPWIELIGTAGGPVLLRQIFDQLVQGGFDEAASARALEALNLAARRPAKPSGSLDSLGGLLGSTDENIRNQALRLAGNWKLPQFVPQLVAVAKANGSSTETRQIVFDSLREIGGKTVITDLEPLTSRTNAAPVRRQAVLTLASVNLDKGAQPAVDWLMDSTSETDAAEFWRALLGIKNSGSRIAHLLPKTGLKPEMAKAGLRMAREGGRNEPDLVWALTRGADLEGEAQTLSQAELEQLAASAAKNGDAARGEKLFRRPELACYTCHAIGGVGGKVGPDLTSIGASSPVDYLVESVLYPNRKIKEGYHSVIVETKDGMEYSGVLSRESSEELVIRDATNKEITLAKKDIQNRSTGNSLMPSGLIDGLSPEERQDLIRFLSELGKPGNYDASKGNVARSWKLFAQTLDVAQFGDEKVLNTKLTESQWKPARTLVDGRLLKTDLSSALEEVKSRDPQAVYAATKLQVSRSGPIAFNLSGADAAALWIDGKLISNATPRMADLSEGAHTLVLKIGARNLPEDLRLESPEATFLAN
jgi:putative heme-binding domain-containing protein